MRYKNLHRAAKVSPLRFHGHEILPSLINLAYGFVNLKNGSQTNFEVGAN